MSTVSVDIHHGGYFMDQSKNVYQMTQLLWLLLKVKQKIHGIGSLNF